MFKRIGIFILLNIAIVITISLLLQIFQIGPYLTAHGVDYKMLAVFCFIWGMVGALISLLLSRKMAKWMLSLEIVTPLHASSAEARRVYDVTERLARAAGLPETPEVGIYQSSDINAFATGPSKRRSLIAVSSALINRLSPKELEAVIGHEISHIANGDMVTMTLLQGVINAFVMFLARAIAIAVSGMGKNQDNRKASSYATYMIVTLVLEVVFMILGALIIAAFSRYREYRADKGSAGLVGKEAMIGALEALKIETGSKEREKIPESLAAFMIREPNVKRSFKELFATHPSLDKRIARLREA